jgi:hypothetical protein
MLHCAISLHTHGYDVFELQSKRAQTRNAKALCFQDVAASKAQQPTAWSCRNCGNTDTKRLTLCGSVRTCVCGVVAEQDLVATHRDRLGASEADDKTQRCDRTAPVVDPGDARDGDADVRRRERVAGATMTMVSSRGLRNASTVITESRLTELTPEARDALKSVRTLQQLERLFRTLSPIDEILKRHVRVTFDKTWSAVTQHARHCALRADACELRCQDRSAFCIAVAAFDLALDRILQNPHELPSLRRETIVILKSRLRVAADASQTRASAHLAAVKSTLALVLKPDFDVCKTCEVPTPSPAGPQREDFVGAGKAVQRLEELRHRQATGGPVRLQRTDSGVTSTDKSIATTGILEMRNVLLACCSSVGAHMRVQVKSLKALGSPGFLDKALALPCMRDADAQTLAFYIAIAAQKTISSLGKRVAPDGATCAKFLTNEAAALQAVAELLPLIKAEDAPDPSQEDSFL